MGHKHPGKITKKFVSVLAASAMLTTQIPANLSAGAANTDNGQKNTGRFHIRFRYYQYNI